VTDFQEIVDWCSGVGTRQLLISRDGETVLEENWDADPATTTDVASLQKCFSSIVLGQLVTEGVMALDAPVSDYVGAGWSQTTATQEAAITIRHVVSMRSGLNDAFEYDSAPGADWYYCNNAYHQVRKAMELATGLESEPLFAQRLWGPLGMNSTSWQLRPEMTDPHGWVLSGVHTTARDMARFGEAVLRRDSRLGCSAEFLDLMLTGTDTNPSYGLLWWLYAGTSAVVPGLRKGQEFDKKKVFGGVQLDRGISASAPADCIAGHGAGNQRIYIVPSQRLVVARIATPGDMNAPTGPFDEEFWAHMPEETRNPG